MPKRIVVSDEVYEQVHAHAAHTKVDVVTAANKLITTAVGRLQSLAKYQIAKTGVQAVPQTVRQAAAAQKKAEREKKKAAANRKKAAKVERVAQAAKLKVVTPVESESDSSVELEQPVSTQLSLPEAVPEVG